MELKIDLKIIKKDSVLLTVYRSCINMEHLMTDDMKLFYKIVIIDLDNKRNHVTGIEITPDMRKKIHPYFPMFPNVNHTNYYTIFLNSGKDFHSILCTHKLAFCENFYTFDIDKVICPLIEKCNCPIFVGIDERNMLLYRANRCLNHHGNDNISDVE